MESNTPKPEGASAQKPTQRDPHTEIKDHLAKFLLSLIQAFLRTGYYTADHPQSKSAKEGLFEDFQNLLDNKYELTFLVSHVPGGEKILIEGMLPEPQELRSIMLQGMADMYTPKFATFLKRKDLISLTLKAAMSWTEFNNFVDLIGEPTFADTLEKSDKERFSQALRERGIFNISYIFNEELLAGERDIPWRSQVALSRLRKDFKMIPLYQDLDEIGMKKVRRQIIQDVVRPMQSAEIIYPILANSDLAETEEFKETEIDKEMIASLSGELLLQVSHMFIKETITHKEPVLNQEKSTRLAKQIALSLNLKEVEGRERILEEYYKHELIPIHELPEAIQRKIKKKRAIDKFLRNTDFYLKSFDEIEDPQKYARFAQSLKNIIPELIRRDQYKQIQWIIAQIDHHANEKKDRSRHARQILDEVERGKILKALKAKFMTGQKELCMLIAPIFVTLGERAVPHLLSFLKGSNDQFVLKCTCEKLLEMDPSHIKTILDTLKDEGAGTESTIRIIRALGDMASEECLEPLATALKSYLSHKNPRLREEALWAYYSVMGEEGERVYLALLSDVDMAVQKKAIQCLSRMKSETALERFLEILNDLGDAPLEKGQQIVSTLFSALAFYGNLERPGEGSLEDFLLDTLERQVSLGPLKFLKKKRSVLSEGAVAAICETLGKIGTDKSRPVLEKFEKQDNMMWKNKAGEALKEMDRRAGISQH
jgi:HEAT repeat protein